MLMRIRWKPAAAVLLAGLALAGPAAAQPAPTNPAEQAAEDLNRDLLRVYREAKKVRLAQTSPVIVVAFGEAVLIRAGSEQRVDFTPSGYDHFKDMSHTVLGFYGAGSLALSEPKSDWAGEFRSLRQRAAAVLPQLAALGFAGDRLERQTKLLRAAIDFADRGLAEGAVTQETLTAYARQQAPLILANATEAAAVQLDGLHALVRKWRAEIGEVEWQRLYVIILGPRMPRAGNLQFQYFVNAMGAPAIDQRLFYAEGIFDVKGGLDLLATIVTDRELSTTVFADPLRMDRDLLADGAEARLLTMFGRIGAVPVEGAPR
jgi:hypothetical protein